MVLGVYASVVRPSLAEESLGSGYAVTSKYHGMNVISGPVIATAMTTDTDVYQVTFLWKNPAGDTVFTEVKTLYTNSSKYGGMDIHFADSIQTPNAPGDWGVQALFQSPDGKTKEGIVEVVSIKATSFFVVPEVVVLGTLGTLGTMLLGFGIFRTRKSATDQQKPARVLKIANQARLSHCRVITNPNTSQVHEGIVDRSVCPK
jgi:hypothetical protein